MQGTARQQGFTIVEMAVVVPILILIALALFQALFMIIQTSDEERVGINLAYEKNVAMDEIESDVRLAPLFVPQLDANVAGQDPNENPSQPWSYIGGGPGKRTLILREYSTSSNPLVPGHEPVFIGSGAACNDPSITTNTIQTYDTLYFVQNETLYRRRVVDPFSKDPTCTTQYQRTSCPTGSATCPADEVIATDVTTFEIHYYSTGDPSETELDAYSDSSLLAGARSVQVDLTQTRPAGGTNVSSSISLRIATLNQSEGGS